MDLITFIAAWIARKKSILVPKHSKINVGCGLTVKEGWINIDSSINALIAGFPPFFTGLFYQLSGARAFYTREEYITILKEHDFIYRDVRYGIPMKEASMDAVYSSHFLEHLSRKDTEFFLHEAYRVLKQGGVLRVCVPDLSYVVSLYSSREKVRFLSYFFHDGQASRLSRHQYMYDFELLESALSDAGFTDIVQCRWQEGRCPDIKELDNRPDETLYVEARKLKPSVHPWH